MARAKIAQRLMAAHNYKEVEVTIGRGSDFLVPHVYHSSIGRLFPNIVQGKRVMFIGNLNQSHPYTYIKDFARALVVQGENATSFGQVCHVSNATTGTTRKFQSMAFELASFKPKITAISKTCGMLGSLFNSDA